MATVQEVILGAMRKLGVIAPSQTPRNDELEVGRQACISMYRQFISSGMFGRMDDVVVASDYVAGPNQHVFRSGTFSSEIEMAKLLGISSMTQNSDNEYNKSTDVVSTLVDQITPPADCSVVFISDNNTGITSHFIFDGQGKKWMNVDNLQYSAEMPLADRDFEGIKAMIATLIADEFMVEPSALTYQHAQQFKSNLATRWAAPKRSLRRDFF